ncbi:hypothetical protein COC42_01920 [Sphingomonas spermidinifaciens]|uniref:Flagellar motor switch protein FliN-like C-terminal domain-containing protein n=1 Tax=Sphingomonas spermidinifaciens TaxID=1141889 RepID=A0A2A4B1Y4_9SPHN|nr:hypothetical protein [Sphingomonas spermidinifaciens]PCD03203.1 hypothetical protein COC42_01920 [Sphingomonas spermidinifaciens]
MNAVLTLPAMDPDEAERRRVAVAALTGVKVDGLVLGARIEGMPDLRGGWLRFANGAGLAIDRLEGAPLRFDADDAVGAAALIERAESLIAAVEAALGVSLEPEDLSAEPPAGLIVTIEHGAASRLRLALPVALPLLPARADFAPELVGALTLPATLSIEGPRIAPHDAAGLGQGDLLLIGGDTLPARLNVAGRSIAGRFDPAARQFHILSIGAS